MKKMKKCAAAAAGPRLGALDAPLGLPPQELEAMRRKLAEMEEESARLKEQQVCTGFSLPGLGPCVGSQRAATDLRAACTPPNPPSRPLPFVLAAPPCAPPGQVRGGGRRGRRRRGRRERPGDGRKARGGRAQRVCGLCRLRHHARGAAAALSGLRHRQPRHHPHRRVRQPQGAGGGSGWRDHGFADGAGLGALPHLAILRRNRPTA
jgi:hypothetical protein